MPQGSSKVHVIVAPDYGEHLAGLPPSEPAWVADTPANKPVIERMWAQKWPALTSFRVDLGASSENWLVSILDEVELHHGEYSQSRPYSELCVTGAGLSAELREELESYGFKRFEVMPDGFLANKVAA
jgi:hypothetical protein